MKYDRFYGRKSVHVKLDKGIHVALREKLFKYDVTMQDLFHEAAELAVSDSAWGEKLLQRIAKKKMMLMIKQANEMTPSPQLNELDSETLYNLLEDGKDGGSDT